MALVAVDAADQQRRAAHASDWLADNAPGLSARTLLSKGQRTAVIIASALVLAGLVLSARDLGVAIVACATLAYAGIVANRIWMTVRALRRPNLVVVSDDEARAAPDDALPLYTVLVPLYHEADVVPQLMASLRALDYPRRQLDLKLLVEQGDDETLAAVMAMADDGFEVVVVPDDGPRTKPRALNYGLTLARGEFVTIFDAEDRPDQLQLRKAAVAFGRLPARVACLQARLDYWNSEQNLITRWFGTEYLQWFRLLLPGLADGDSPIPLGGTSNHIRRSVLEGVGAWDPYNVTEDADLGIRIHRAGYRCAVLDSDTWEEANSDYVNWTKQRSRWYKGYLQTWLVHMRHPAVLLDELGWRGWLEFNAFVGGTPVLALVNFAFWALTVLWFAGHFHFVQALFPSVVYYPALVCFVFGNAAMAYLYVVSAYMSRRTSLVWAACLVPIYWVMMSIAALKAFWQLFVSRSLWEKTLHGLAVEARGEQRARPEAVSSWPVTAPTFDPGGPPVLAAAVDAGRTGARHTGVRQWEAGLGRLLRVVGLALVAVLLYVFALAPLVASSPSHRTVAVPQSRAPADGTVVAWLSIPGGGVDTPVVEGTEAASLHAAVGHLRGTALPGERGVAVVVGHRTVDGGALSGLGRVRPGDLVVVRTGGGSAHYVVTSASSQARAQLVTAAAPATLVVVTGGPGIGGTRLTVVRAALVSEHGVRFTGTEPPVAGSPVVPGGDLGSAFAALLWLAAFVVALRLGERLSRSWGRAWAVALTGSLALLALAEVCVSVSNALPVTF